MKLKRQLQTSQRRKQLIRQQQKMINRRQFYFNQTLSVVARQVDGAAVN
ncbi:hypothetical protein [Litorilituus sediminis]|nr:hypothetical protein [Litorilituus sediminis]